MSAPKTVAAHVLDRLAAWGVHRFYGYPGDGIGGIFTAVIALGVLVYLNWVMTSVILVLLVAFGGGMTVAFSRLRPIFR